MAEITDEEYLAQHPEHRELDPAIRHRLRITEQLQADLDSERASRTQLERRAAFLEAGLADLPHRELFEKSYEGEMNAEAIREAAGKYGLIPDPNAPIQNTNAAPDNQADLDALRRTQQASQGAPAGAPMEFADALARASTRQEWDAVMANAPAESGIRLKGSVQGHRLV